MIRRIVYGPPNYLNHRLTVEDRRAIGFWTLVFGAVGTLFFGSLVFWVSILSVLALVPNYTSETSVETE